MSSIVRISRLFKQNVGRFSQPVRNGHHEWHYRNASNKHPKIVTKAAELVGGFAWWWVLWHLWTESGHITGEFEYPDASKWSDDDLGVPADDDDRWSTSGGATECKKRQ